MEIFGEIKTDHLTVSDSEIITLDFIVSKKKRFWYKKSRLFID